MAMLLRTCSACSTASTCAPYAASEPSTACGQAAWKRVRLWLKRRMNATHRMLYMAFSCADRAVA